MEDQDKNKRKEKEKKTISVPNHWEPVPGQALVAEEIERRIREEEREARLRKEKEG